jgi:hypothetical protein
MGPVDFRTALITALGEAKTEAEKIGREAGGREMSLVITKLEEALLWANQSFQVRE